MNQKRSILMSLVAIAGLAAGGASNAAEPLNMDALETISATVESVDQATRMVTLKNKEGRTVTFEVSPQVRNLAQVKVGDTLVVRYYQSIAAEIKPKGTSPTLDRIAKSSTEERAAPGATPGAAVRTIRTTTVVIQAVDKQTHSLTFSGPDGLTRNVQVKRPEAQAFANTLSKGDEVELTYSEALAVSVEGTKQ